MNASPAPRPRQRIFNSRYRQVRLSPERAERQGLIAHLAFGLLGGRDETISFLNTHNVSLGARPLDLAMVDAAGYAAVEGAIRQLAREPIGQLQ